MIRLLLVATLLFAAAAESAQCQGPDGNWYPYSDPICTGGMDPRTLSADDARALVPDEAPRPYSLEDEYRDLVNELKRLKAKRAAVQQDGPEESAASADSAKCLGPDGNWHPYSDPICTGGEGPRTPSTDGVSAAVPHAAPRRDTPKNDYWSFVNQLSRLEAERAAVQQKRQKEARPKAAANAEPEDNAQQEDTRKDYQARIAAEKRARADAESALQAERARQEEEERRKTEAAAAQPATSGGKLHTHGEAETPDGKPRTRPNM